MMSVFITILSTGCLRIEFIGRNIARYGIRLQAGNNVFIDVLHNTRQLFHTTYHIDMHRLLQNTLLLLRIFYKKT